MEEIKELAKCVKCNEFSEVDTDIALMSNPPQYQFTCSSCSNKQFIWGSFIYRIPRSILAKADEYESKAKAYNDTLKTLDKLINNDERYKEARSNDFVAGMLIAYENIFNLMEDYIKESGEYDAKK